MNVDISRVLIDNKLGLSESQANKSKNWKEYLRFAMVTDEVQW